MNKYDKKAAWETVEVVYWRGNVKCQSSNKENNLKWRVEYRENYLSCGTML